MTSLNVLEEEQMKSKSSKAHLLQFREHSRPSSPLSLGFSKKKNPLSPVSPFEPMADGEGGGGGGEGDGGGSSECLPMDDLVEAMLRNSQALAEALAADRARREAAARIQRESWEAALKEKDAEIDRLRAEASEANKKLQVDVSRKMRWEATYELLLVANQKLAELRDADMEDSRTCAEIPNSKLKEVESCTKLSQNTVDHTASDFRKLKHDYETLSSKKDKEVSALLSENDSLCSQLDIMQRDNTDLLKNKELVAAQALKLQKSVDELKMLAQKKDDEIARLQAEAVGAKKEHDKDLSALLLEMDSVRNQLSVMQQNYTELLKSKKVLTQKKDHEIVILRAEALGAKKKVQKMHSLVKDKDDEIQRLKGWQAESVQKHYMDISETHKRSRSGDPAVAVREKLKNTSSYSKTSSKGQTVDHISDTKTVEKDGQDETTQKRRRASSMSNDDKKSGSNEDDDEKIESDEDGEKQNGSDEDGEKQTGSDEDGDKQTGSDEDGDRQTGSDQDGDEQSGIGDEGDGDNDKQSGGDEETTHNQVEKPLGNPKSKRGTYTAQVTNGKWYNNERKGCDEHDEDKQSVSYDDEAMNDPVQKPLGNPKRKRDSCNARVTNCKATVKAMGKVAILRI